MRRRWLPGRRRRVETVEPARTTRVRDEVVEERRPPRDRLWPWLLLLLLLVLAGLGALWYFTREDEDKSTVPRVVGMTEALARARVQEEGLQPDVDRRPSERRRGVVFAQSPGAGIQLDEGERVELLVSSGLPGEPVPQVVGLREAEAGTRLGAAGLKTRVRRAFTQRPRGIVVEQNPAPRTRVVRGTTVEIVVSRGPRIVVVPDVVGQDQQEAVAALRRLDLRANLVQVPSVEPRGIVLAQNPAGGSRAQAGSSVRLNVSTGGTQTQTTTTATTGTRTTRPARVRVPAVVGERQTSALVALQRAGLRGDVVYVPSSRPAGTVVAQRPAPGTTVARDSAVRINVSQGPNAQERRAVPDVVGMDEQAARQTLQQAGFRVEVIREPAADPSEEGLVVDQQPAGGTRAPRGATVTIYVAEPA